MSSLTISAEDDLLARAEAIAHASGRTLEEAGRAWLQAFTQSASGNAGWGPRDTTSTTARLLRYEILPYRFDERHWYDSLITAAASQAGCETLYTEDGLTGAVISGVRLVNPFTAAG